jgi:putative hydrolase of the HAD superfamily
LGKKKLIFDFDNTLAYREGMWSATIYEILQENGYKEISYDNIEPYTKLGFPWNDYEFPHKNFFKNLSWWEYMEKMITEILINLNIYTTEAEKLSKLFREKYLDIERWHLFDDTYEVLDQANKKKYECYILTNHTPEIHDIIKGLKLNKFIKKVFNSAEIGYEKPHYKIYQTLLNDLNDKPENFIMIGDNYISDVTGARSNGIFAILVRKENDFNYKYYCKDLKDIFDVIAKIEN